MNCRRDPIRVYLQITLLINTIPIVRNNIPIIEIIIVVKKLCSLIWEKPNLSQKILFDDIKASINFFLLNMMSNPTKEKRIPKIRSIIEFVDLINFISNIRLTYIYLFLLEA